MLRISLVESIFLFWLSLLIGWIIIPFCYINAIKPSGANVPEMPVPIVGNVRIDLVGSIVPLVIATSCLVIVYFLTKHRFSKKTYFFALLFPTIIGGLLACPSMLRILKGGNENLSWSIRAQGSVSAFVAFLTIYLGMKIISYLKEPLQKQLEFTRKNSLILVLMSYSIATFSVFLIDIVFVLVVWQVGMHTLRLTIGGAGIADGMFLCGIYSTIFLTLFVVLSTMYTILKSRALAPKI